MKTYYAFRKGELWGLYTVGVTPLVTETQRPILYTRKFNEKTIEVAIKKGFELKEYQL